MALPYRQRAKASHHDFTTATYTLYCLCITLLYSGSRVIIPSIIEFLSLSSKVATPADIGVSLVKSPAPASIRSARSFSARLEQLCASGAGRQYSRGSDICYEVLYHVRCRVSRPPDLWLRVIFTALAENGRRYAEPCNTSLPPTLLYE